MDTEDVTAADLVSYLSDIVQKLNLGHRGSFSKLIMDAHPNRQWQFETGDNRADIAQNKGYFDNWLRALASCLRLTEVSKLPGWPTESN